MTLGALVRAPGLLVVILALAAIFVPDPRLRLHYP
jgi:hypothetical protein